MTRNYLKSVFFILIIFLFVSFLPLAASTERYDKILEKIERVSKKENTTFCFLYPQKPDWQLTFEHEKLPNLDGVWTLKKKSIKRHPILVKQYITKTHCNSRIPFEERPIEKEVVISPQGVDLFVMRSLYPASYDTYPDLNKSEIKFQNYNLKGVVIPSEITYAYTLKLVNGEERPANPRQLWLNGRLFFDKITNDKINGKGYEIVYTPECQGYLRDDVEFELVRKDTRDVIASEQ